MGNIFGRAKPLKEVLRENKRMISKAVRELDRERSALEKEEKRLISDIKKFAKQGQMGSVKIMAKDLVRTRQYITKFIEMRSHLQGAALKLQTVKSHQAMAESMSSVAKAMTKMNKVVNIPAINKMMREFSKENEKSELMQEMMGDAMDDAMADEGSEEAENQVVNQVLDEIGINFAEDMGEAPTTGLKMAEAPAAQVKQAAGVGVGGGGGGSGSGGGSGGGGDPPAAPGGGGGDPEVSELEARLNNLRR